MPKKLIDVIGDVAITEKSRSIDWNFNQAELNMMGESAAIITLLREHGNQLKDGQKVRLTFDVI